MDTGMFFRDFKTGGSIIPRKTETRLVDERRDVTSWVTLSASHEMDRKHNRLRHSLDWLYWNRGKINLLILFCISTLADATNWAILASN